MKNLLAKKIRFYRALRALYETDDGKVFFEEMCNHCGVTRPQFTKDPIETAWNEGRRHLAMSYLKILSLDDVDSLKLRMENDNNGDYDDRDNT